MRKRALLILALAMLIATAGVIYAHWQETLTVDVEVATGDINPVWSLHGTNDDGVDDTYGTAGWDDEPAAAPTWGSGSSRDPSAKFTDPAYGRYAKDVADCIAAFGQEANQDQLVVTISNAYPSYWCTVLADLHNAGTVPVKLQSMTVTATRDPAGIDPEAPIGIFPVAGGWYLDSGTGIYPEVEVFFEGAPFFGCGYQLDPGATLDFYGHFHPDQDALELASYKIAVDFNWVNWNEYVPANASGCLNVIPGDPMIASSAGMRIKGAPGPDVYLGEGNLGDGANRVQADAGNPLPSGSYPFTLSYNAANHEVTLVGPAAVNLLWDTDNAPATCMDWDIMKVTVRDIVTTGGIAFSNIVLNGVPLGNFGTVDVPGTPGVAGWQYWSVVGFNIIGNWTLTGNLDVVNLNSNESLKAEISVGCS